jgi:NAD(P)H dehydrogenase (quinone)
MNFREVVVTGAIGDLGSEVVAQLRRFVPSFELGVSARSPEKASLRAETGIRVRRGDFNAPETLDRAFGGARRVLLISTRRRALSGTAQCD